jgi:hypothetical protein
VEPTQVVVPVEIGVVGRWEACALLDRLASYRSFIFQHGEERWVVHPQMPGGHGEIAESALVVLEECHDERGVEETSIRVDGKPYRRPATTAGSLS